MQVYCILTNGINPHDVSSTYKEVGLEEKGACCRKQYFFSLVSSTFEIGKKFGIMMDTGGLIRKLSKFIAPLSDYVPGELCRNHSIAYLNGLLNGSTWATRSK
jgi:hypothetical protein